jgi:hypothetical protein
VAKTPQTHLVQRSPEQVACTSCDVPIEEGEPRFSEAVVGDDGKFARSLRYARTPRPRESYDDDDRGSSDHGPNPDLAARYYHLECAAKHVPFRLSSALAHTTLPLENRDQLRESIQRAIDRQDHAIDPAAEADETRGQYEQFISQLREATDEEGLVVFGDWLQTVGDPRGELVTLQFQIESATGWTRDRLIETERKLFATHRKQLQPDRSNAFIWRRGFVFRVDLPALEAPAERVLAHPSLQLVRELVARDFPPVVPATLRTLEIDAWSMGALGELATVPQLARLRLPTDAPLQALQHPSLRELELVAPYEHAVDLRKLDRKRLPALRRLKLLLPFPSGEVIASLAKSSIFPQLEELVLLAGITVDDLAPLASKSQLALLDLHGSPLRHDDAEALRGLATVVELPPAPVAPPSPVVDVPWQVRHTKRPEWGIGRVLEETEEGLRVEFEHGGEKLIRTPDFLEDIS